MGKGDASKMLKNQIYSSVSTLLSLLMDYFTVVGIVSWPLNGSEAGVDRVLIKTSLLLWCKSSCSYAN